MIVGGSRRSSVGASCRLCVIKNYRLVEILALQSLLPCCFRLHRSLYLLLRSSLRSCVCFTTFAAVCVDPWKQLAGPQRVAKVRPFSSVNVQSGVSAAAATKCVTDSCIRSLNARKRYTGRRETIASELRPHACLFSQVKLKSWHALALKLKHVLVLAVVVQLEVY